MSDKKVYKWLRQDGFSHAAASGILGNLKQESGTNPNANQPGGPGRGIAQWSEGERWDQLVAFANRNGKDPEDLRTQYEFMLKEMKAGIFGFELDKFKRLGNAREAARYFNDHFEKAGINGDREQYAKEYKQEFRDMPDGENGGPTAADIVRIARKGLGVPYVGGLGAGASPKTGWDCASFVGWVLRQAGYKNPPTFSENFIGEYPKVKGWNNKGRNMQPGDIIVYRRPGSDGVLSDGHVAIYVGKGKYGKETIIEAASPSKDTQYGRLMYPGSKPIVAVVRPAKNPGNGVSFKHNGAPGRYGESSQEAMMEQYGITEDFLNLKDSKGRLVNGELKELIERAVDKDWSPDFLRNKIRNSEWYKTRNEKMRQFDMMNQTDRDDLLAKTRISLDVLAGNMGVELTDKQKRNIAFRIARNGMDENMTALLLSRKYRPRATEEGNVAIFQKQVNDLADQYGYKISEADMTQWTRENLAGQSTADGYEDVMRDWAQRRAPYLDLEGTTLRSALSQYVNSAAQELGQDADQIDLSDDKWLDVYNVDQKRMMSSGEWRRKIREDKRYGWENSEKGAQTGRNLAASLAAAFGRV